MQNTLIHIGFHKTGTTYLQRYFEHHPDINYDQTIFEKYRETGIIGDEITKSYESGLRVLSEEQLTVWGGKLDRVGLKFIDYGVKNHQLKICKDLFSMFPNSKILITVREYNSLIPSLYSQYVLNGGILCFKQFLSTNNHLAELFDYNYVTSMYKEVFSEKNVLVVPYELLKEDPKMFLKKIENFVEIPSTDFSNKVINKSLPEQKMSVIRFTSYSVYFLLKIFSEERKNKIFKKYVNLLFYLKSTHFDKIKSKPVSKKKIRLLNMHLSSFSTNE